MSAISFFDKISDSKSSFFTFAENYFYLKGISGRLGFRRFSLLCKHLDGTGVLQSKPEKNLKISALLKTILKIMSYGLLLLPAFFFVIKTIYRRRFQAFKIAQPKIATTSSPPPTKNVLAFTSQTGKAHVEGLWKDYLERHCSTSNPQLAYHLSMVESEKKERPFLYSNCNPKTFALSQPLLAFQNDPEALFVPNLVELKNADDVQALCKTLAAGFATGRSYIGATLGTHRFHHGVAAVFHKSGQFRIIDSMLSSAVDLQVFNQQLNAANILNNGKPMHFTGELINTRLQKGTNECLRFATLYVYQMLKERNLDAFEKVNGAFADGKLKRFEDYKTIQTSKGIRDASSLSNTCYRTFMDSWLYRCHGLPMDDWREITLKDVVTMQGTNVDNLDEKDWVDIFVLKPDSCSSFQIQKSNRLYIRENSGTEKATAPLPCTALNATFQSLIPSKPGCCQIIMYHIENAAPTHFILQANETFHGQLKDGHIEKYAPEFG